MGMIILKVTYHNTCALMVPMCTSLSLDMSLEFQTQALTAFRKIQHWMIHRHLNLSILQGICHVLFCYMNYFLLFPKYFMIAVQVLAGN
jgi:hypothetical protein